ncbi:hypothetical protein BH24ACT5_BH24ACT5_06320 [soil metagenome]
MGAGFFTGNVRGTFLVSQSAASAMVAAGVGGSIVNIASIQAEVATPDTVLYSTTKGAVNQLTRSMAVALGSHRIRVNAVAPGRVRTGFNTTRFDDPAIVEQVLRGVVLDRVGEPADVAAAIEFLASDRSDWITGAILNVDGGILSSH